MWVVVVGELHQFPRSRRPCVGINFCYIEVMLHAARMKSIIVFTISFSKIINEKGVKYLFSIVLYVSTYGILKIKFPF